jgi:hypothetical protein
MIEELGNIGLRHALEDALEAIEGRPLDSDRRKLVCGDLATRLGAAARGGSQAGDLVAVISSGGADFREYLAMHRRFGSLYGDKLPSVLAVAAKCLGCAAVGRSAPLADRKATVELVEAWLNEIRLSRLLCPLPSPGWTGGRACALS